MFLEQGGKNNVEGGKSYSIHNEGRIIVAGLANYGELCSRSSEKQVPYIVQEKIYNINKKRSK